MSQLVLSIIDRVSYCGGPIYGWAPLSEYWRLGPRGPPGIVHAPESGSVVVRNWLKQSRQCWTVDLQRAM